MNECKEPTKNGLFLYF